MHPKVSHKLASSISSLNQIQTNSCKFFKDFTYFTKAVVNYIIHNKNWCLKLETNATEKHFHQCSQTFGLHCIYEKYVVYIQKEQLKS